ncbi:MAG: leucine-rich repeat protein [Lachnospiraceae bacterium]|nr:leucine-rich repeat protein [Lachnospiraceae bacterium]
MKKKIRTMLLCATLAAAVALSGVPVYAAGSNTSGRTTGGSSGSSSSSSSRSSSSSSGGGGGSSSSSSYTETVTTSSGAKETVRVSSKGTASVTSVSSTKATVKIDSYANADGIKYKVVAVSANAFAKCPNMTKVSLPKTITKFGKNAFKGAKKLTNIRLNRSKSIKINKAAFSGLKTAGITITVNKNMGDKAFKKMQVRLNKAGFKGTLKRAKK